LACAGVDIRIGSRGALAGLGCSVQHGEARAGAAADAGSAWQGACQGGDRRSSKSTHLFTCEAAVALGPPPLGALPLQELQAASQQWDGVGGASAGEGSLLSALSSLQLASPGGARAHQTGHPPSAQWPAMRTAGAHLRRLQWCRRTRQKQGTLCRRCHPHNIQRNTCRSWMRHPAWRLRGRCSC
jgi:hypothetical protein